MVLCLQYQKQQILFNEFCAYLPPSIYCNGIWLFFVGQDKRVKRECAFFALMSKKTKETMAAEIAANIKKKGFILYKKDLNLCCAHFDDTAIGRIMRHINEYVKNPSYSPQKIEFAEQLQYDLFVDGIRENTEEWRDKIVQRRLRYEESKKNNSDNSDKTNNSDNCDNPDKTDKTKKTGIDKKNTSEDNTVQSSQVQSSQATSNDVSSTQINSNSKKEFNVNNKIFFNNKEYTRRYLAEKKIFLKPSAFDAFFDYNVSIGFPYKPDTAAKRWIKKNPEDEQKPVTKKEAPQPPTTPPDLAKFREDLLEAVRPFVGAVDFKTWIEPVQVFKIQQNINNTFDIALSVKSKFFAQYLKQHFEREIADAFKILKGVEPCIYYTFPDGYELKTFQPGKLKCLSKN